MHVLIVVQKRHTILVMFTVRCHTLCTVKPELMYNDVTLRGVM